MASRTLRVWGVLILLLILLYPLLAYWSLARWEPRYLGLAVVLVYLLRGLLLAGDWLRRGAILALAVLVALGFWLFNSEELVRLVPAFISLCMAGLFVYSLLFPPTFPGRVALKVHGVLEPHVEAYTTRVTQVWVVFFLINAGVSVASAFWASREVWALYNGLIAYVLVALLFAAEYAYRKLVFYRHQPPR